MRAWRKSVLYRAEIFTGSTCSTHAIKKYFIQRKKNNSETVPHNGIVENFHIADFTNPGIGFMIEAGYFEPDMCFYL